MFCYCYPSFWLDRLKFEAVLVRAKIDCFAQAALTIAFLNFCFRGYCCKNVFHNCQHYLLMFYYWCDGRNDRRYMWCCAIDHTF